MGRSADEISREIADTRGDMERKIVALRERGQRTMRQGVRVAMVAGALAGAAVAAFVIYRVRRPPTWQQRVIRTVPKGWRGRLQGLYDLTSGEATRSGEWRDGAGRLLKAGLPAEAANLLKPYLDIIGAYNSSAELRAYPGSPLIARALLRPDSRAIAEHQTE